MMKIRRMLIYLCILIAMINCKDVVEETLEFVIQGESKMKLSEESEAIIVIGNTGSGKSTFVHYLQDPSHVESIESEKSEAIDYIVVDHMDVAPDSLSTTVSKTIVPELLIDQRNKVWYDCPGFSDTRNSSVEISTTFFLKSILDNTQFLKIVFVVNFGSVSVGYDRVDFDTLMMHGTKLIKSIGRYNNSVALIISKTPSARIRGNKIFDVTENEVIQSTGDFIADYRTVLSEKLDSEMKLKLVDALLEKSDDGKYSKIGIFFRPNDVGTFDKIPKMMATRTSLLKLINERVNYTEIRRDDFGYTLSARAELDMKAMMSLVERNIALTVIKMDEVIANQIYVIGGKKDSLYSRRDFFEAIHEQIGEIHQKLQFEKWMQQTHDFLTKFNLSIPKDDFKILIRQQKAINLITLLSPETASNNYALEATQKCVEEERNWYSFLVFLYEFLSSYDIQKTPELYNVQDINDWGHAHRPQGLHLHANNWKQFLSVQKGFYELIKPIFMTTGKFNEINEIIRSTVQSKMHVQCSGQLAVFKAEFILLSKVDAKICNGASNIYIFAQNTIYIDDDRIYNNVQNLVILAHQWNVIRSVKIDLSAESNVVPPPPPHVATEQKPDGMDGKPGEPGKNGGNLFGYANIITNGKLLEIDVSGGRGGRGQDGSRAWPETPRFDIPSSRKFVNNLEPVGILQTHRPYKYRYVTGGYKESVYEIIGAICSREFYRITCTARARQCCKIDGLAGVGGVGGLHGSVILVEGNKNKTEQTITNVTKQNGEEGENGEQVSPCRTKMLIINYDVVCYDPLGIGKNLSPLPRSKLSPRTEARFFLDSTVDDDFCDDSKEYSAYNKEGRQEAKPHKPLEITFLINDFKSSLIKNMDKSIRFGEVSKIYNAIDSNSNIFNMYSLIDFVYESNLLEIRYFELNENVNFLPLYESLLARLQKFGDKMDSTLNKENRKIFATLYTMVLTKANALRIGLHSNLVIDVDKYLGVVISNIRKLDDAGRTKLVNEYSDQYRRELNAKIAEADRLINQVTSYVREKFKTIDDQLYDVIDEAIDRQNKAHNQIHNQEKALIKIRENAILRGMLSVLDMVGKAAGGAGPQGKLAESLISIGTGIGRQFIVDPNDTMNRPVEVPKGVKNTILDLEKVVQKRKDAKIEALNKEIGRLEKELKDDKEDVNEKVQRRQDTSISKLKKKLEDAKKAENPSEEMINRINDEIKKFVDDERNTINSDVEIKQSKKQRLMKFFENCGNAVDVLSAGVDVYNTIAKDIDKVNKMEQAIRGSRQRLRELRQFEQVVHDKLIPEMIALHNSLEETRKSLGIKSHVSLDVQKWKIQETVKDAKAMLLRSIEGYGSESTVSSCMDKLLEALNMIVDIYNRIQDYEEHTRLVFYLGQLQTANFRSIQISDENFRQIFENLTINIQSNIIIGQYLNAVSAFKQTVFPFAANYLEISRLPKSAMSQKDMRLSELIEILAPQIEILRNSVRELNSSVINKDDALISNAKFGSKYPGSPQFYVWDNKYFEEEIANLLAGKAVYLFADVTQGIHLNAVKFNTINIDFVSPNVSIQAEVNQLLAPANILMTHLGTSYYRCDNQFYVIESPSQLIRFSFKKEYDEPISRNVVYDKLRSSGNILSTHFGAFNWKMLTSINSKLMLRTFRLS